MTGRLILSHDASRGAWLEARRRGVSASEIAAVMGISPYESPLSLYHRKRGDLDEQPDSDAMSLGRHLESWIAGRFADRHPELPLGAGGLYAHQARPWQLATPDRLLFESPQPDGSDPISALEIKSDASYDGWGDEGTADVPVHYRAQVLWQLDTLGLAEGRIACLFLHTRRIREYLIERDDAGEADLHVMRREAAIFMDQLADGAPPPVDGHTATTATLQALHGDVDERAVEIGPQLAHRYRSAVRRAREADERKRRYSNQILARLGDARTATARGEKVATRSVYERKPYTVAGATVHRLNPTKQKGPANE